MQRPVLRSSSSSMKVNRLSSTRSLSTSTHHFKQQQQQQQQHPDAQSSCDVDDPLLFTLQVSEDASEHCYQSSNDDDDNTYSSLADNPISKLPSRSSLNRRQNLTSLPNRNIGYDNNNDNNKNYKSNKNNNKNQLVTLSDHTSTSTRSKKSHTVVLTKNQQQQRLP
jgi:hypothetical protein